MPEDNRWSDGSLIVMAKQAGVVSDAPPRGEYRDGCLCQCLSIVALCIMAVVMLGGML